MKPLQRGVFWVTDIDSAEMIIVSAECDTDGNFIIQPDSELLTDNSCEFNHKRVWETFRRSESYNFYPRGRVQIRHGKAVIFCNPVLCTDAIALKLLDCVPTMVSSLSAWWLMARSITNTMPICNILRIPNVCVGDSS